MILWNPDTCACRCNYEIVDDIVTGTIIEPCQYHTTFEDTLNTNRLKNESINAINELFDMTEKEIGFSFNNGELSLTLYNFNELDIEYINQLNLNVNILEG